MYGIENVAVIDEVLGVVGNDPTYISFDIDGFDVVYAPSAGTTEIDAIIAV